MKDKTERETVIVVIYNSIQLYPPTLNAIEILSEYYNRIVVIELDNYEKKGVSVNEKAVSYKIPYQKGALLQRGNVFVRFTYEIHKRLKIENPHLILVYDSTAALAMTFALTFTKIDAKIWYHVHDTADKKYVIPFSLNYFSLKLEYLLLKKAHIFSLPSQERKYQFDLTKFKGKYYFLPNYPLRSKYINYKTLPPKNEVIVLYQGQICPGRGIEELIRILPISIDGINIKLWAIGFVSQEYKVLLDKLIKSRNCENMVSFLGLIPPRNLPVYTSQCHIGMAIYTANDNMHSTLGTASNKTYEYAACGLPYLYYQNEHFKHHFIDKPWAVPTDLSALSLQKAIAHILKNYEALSYGARTDFLEVRNYETVFEPILETVRRKIPV